MKRLTSLPGFEAVAPEVLDQFQAALERIEETIQAKGLTPDVLRDLAIFFGKGGQPGTDLCHLGSGAPAPQWEMTIGDTTLITCGHKPSHTRQKGRP